MFDLDEISRELGFPLALAEVLQEKDGIFVCRAHTSAGSWILKVFEKEEHRREIRNYCLLQKLHINTLRVCAHSERALLLSDLAHRGNYRLASERDMHSTKVARYIAAWYRELHTKGYGCVREQGEELYNENDCFTLENIRQIKEKTGTADLPVWQLVEENMDTVLRVLRQVPKTLVYNDFYYTNMAVSRHQPKALMFDYNLLGKGYAYADLRNVTSSLSKRAGKAFLEAYGPYDPMEKMLDQVISPVVTLYFACRREQFPQWAQSTLEEIKTPYEGNVRQFLNEAEAYLMRTQAQWGMPSDIDAWMALVRDVRGNFPGLETEGAMQEHRTTVERFMEKKQALCVKQDGKIAGVLLFSRKRNMICCLAVDPAFRCQSVARRLMEKALSELDPSRPVTVTTFREEDEKGTAPRALYRAFGFEEGKMTVEYDYPLQEFVLHPKD